MNRRGFMFGLGTGLLITCAVVYFAYGAQRSSWQKDIDKLNADITRLSDVISARLTPPETTDDEPDDSEIDTQTPAPETGPEPESTEPPEQTPGEVHTEAPDTTTEPEAGGDAEEIEIPGDGGDAPDGDETDAETVEPDESVITVQIPKGALSFDICDILYENSIIEDRDVFLSYLKENGLTERLQYGNFELRPGMSHEEIADKIKV